jgi:Ca2+-binding RTX toxin-like protein
MTINPFSPILDTAVSNVIQVLSNSTVAPPSAGTIAFSNSQFSVNENGIPITQVTLTRTGGSTGAVSATLNLSNGTATAGNDYIQTPITVIFADGETSKTVNLTQASQGLSFDGIDDWVDNPATFSDVKDTFTVEFWVNPTATRQANPESSSGVDAYFNQRYAIYPKQGLGTLGTFNDVYAGVSVGTNGITISEHTANHLPSVLVSDIPLSGWNHVALVYKNKTPNLYVNGQFIKTGLTSNYIVHPSNRFGSGFVDNEKTDLSFQGSMDDVRIWNKARTQAEIQADFNKELTGNETGLVGYWNFNSINGNTVQDLSSNNNDGTLSGAQSTTGIVPTSLIINDNIYEGNETLNLTLSNPTGGATLGIQQTATLTIVDDEISGSVITGTPNDDNLIGTPNNDLITGLAGNDKLDGKAGSDNLQGGTGNDTYTIDNLGDIVTENLNEGTDTVRSYITYTLGNNLENLTLLGGSNLSGTGNELNNTLLGNNGNNNLIGGAGNDILDGQAGNDIMQGGLGNDTYTLSSAGDVVTENANEGTDTVKTYLTYTLGNNLENLTLLGNADIDGTGNSLNNSLTGNNFNNTLSGGDGNDMLNGTIGNDTLIGGNGNDSAYYYNATDSVIVNLATGIANDGQDGIDTLSQIENVQGSNTAGDNLTGNTGVNVLYGYGGADILTGGGGNDLLYLGSDTVKDTVNYTSGDGADTVYNFVRGASGDLLKFTGITAIDVQVSGTSTLFKVGDGISSNTGFGSGTLLLTTSATTGFVAADVNVNVNLLGATFAFS